MASPISFSGLSTNLPTDQLIQAILDQEGASVARMQTKQTQNTKRLSLLRTLNSNMLALSTSMGNLSTSAYASRTVSSSDSTNAYVTGTATSAATGAYDVHVDRIATKARLDNASFALSDATTAKVFDDSVESTATFQVAGTDGKTYAITLTSATNSLNGLRDAINAAGVPVQANVINSGSGATPYRMILTAKATGTGSNNGALSITQSGGGANTLGISSSTTVTGLTLQAADPTAKIFNDASVSTASFALQGKDGIAHTFTLSGATNSLEGLRDAINGASAGVTATIEDTGTPGASQYQLRLTQTGGSVTLAETTTGGVLNTLGIAAGRTTTVDSKTVVLGGSAGYTGTYSTGAQIAVDALFSVDGVSMTRQSNVVTDAVDGLALTLKSGGQTGSTTLTVSMDNSAIVTAANDLVNKFNALLKVYRDNAGRAVVKTSTGTTPQDTTGQGSLGADTKIEAGALANDPEIRSLIERLRRDLTFAPDGASTDGYQSGSQIGLKTNRDGTLGVDATALKEALDNNPDQVASVLARMASSLQEHVFSITSPGSGDLANIMSSVNQQNSRLTQQISSGQARLDARRTALQIQFANLERTVGQLQAAGQSLQGLV